MPKMIVIFSFLLFIFNTSEGQSKKLSCSEKEVKTQDSEYPDIIQTCYLKNFKFIHRSYPDGVGRYFDSESEIYVRVNNKFKKITNSKVFNSNQDKLVTIINERIQQDFKDLSTDSTTKECLVGVTSIPNYKMDDFEIYFNEMEIWFEVHWGLSMVCRAVDGTIISFKVSEIEKYLK